MMFSNELKLCHLVSGKKEKSETTEFSNEFFRQIKGC